MVKVAWQGAYAAKSGEKYAKQANFGALPGRGHGPGCRVFVVGARVASPSPLVSPPSSSLVSPSLGEHRLSAVSLGRHAVLSLFAAHYRARSADPPFDRDRAAYPHLSS